MFQKIKNQYHLLQAAAANILYGFPSRRLKVIGITGTDGKTTTTTLVYHILKSSGRSVSMISTINADIAGHKYDLGFHVTTPDSFMIQRFLKMSADNNDEFFVLETTSHALDQNRVWGIRFEVGAITNITHEHLDYHGTFEEYKKTKLKLFKMANSGIMDSNQNEKIIENLPNLTRFNKQNYSVAYRICKYLGLDDSEIIKAMKTFILPKGRMEIVYDHEFKIIIDFAHTPNALFELLPEIRKKYLKNSGKMIHVFGAAGLRDATKRPMMGEASNKYSDKIILTEEDYRTEDPIIICKTIASKIKDNKYEIIINRVEAIKKAISIAKRDDVIVITGKGHEKSLCRGKLEYLYSEHEAVSSGLKELKKVKS